MNIVVSTIVGLILAVSAFAQAGLPDLGIKQNMAVGVVKSVGDEKVAIETKDGTIDAILLSVSSYKVLPPDNLSLSAATDSKLENVSVGDRVLITGKVSDDKTRIMTKTIYLVKGSEIAAMQESERADWQKRGLSGRVVAADPATKTITVETRGITGDASKMVVSPKPEAVFLRYSNNSASFKDAVASNFADIKVDDMIQVLGDKSEDQTTYKAEKLISGAFITVAGTITATDPTKNEVTIKDFKSNKEVTIKVIPSSLVKKFPEEAAKRMAFAQMMQGRQQGGSGPQPPASTRRQRPANTENASKSGEGRRRGQRGQGGARFNINEMLQRFPTVEVAELKPGEMIAASSAKGADPTNLTAIRLLAGIEPFVQMAQASSSKSRSGRGISGGLNIPGLDGMDF